MAHAAIQQETTEEVTVQLADQEEAERLAMLAETGCTLAEAAAFLREVRP